MTRTRKILGLPLVLALSWLVAPSDALAERWAQSSVKDIRIENREVGRERVVVDVEGDVEFRVSSRPGEPARLEISNATVASSAARRLVGERGSLVRSLDVVQQGAHVVVSANLSAALAGAAIRSGDRIVWIFSPSGEAKRPVSATVVRERDYAAEVSAPDVAGFSTPVARQLVGNSSTRDFSGQRIDLDFKDADIHNILRLISEVGNVNVVTSDSVSGTVTIRMRNVPWDQALDVILQAKNLGAIRRGNLIRVAPIDALEKEREAAIAMAKQHEQLAPIETRLLPVSYAAAENVSARVKEMLSSRGTVSVDTRTNMLIVRDISESIDGIEKLVRRLDTQTPQVLIEARIVEAGSQYSRDIGIQWGGAGTMAAATGNPTGIRFPSDVSLTGGSPLNSAPTAGLSPFTPTVSNPNFAVNLPAVTGNGAGGALGLTLGSIGGQVNLNVRLSAAESSGSVRIISSPRVLTLDNQEATISQGTLIPYSQVSAQGVNTAFINAKLELTVTPHVTSDGSVSMSVKISRNEPDFGRTAANGQPTIVSREAETNLLVDDGSTAVIGGIFTRNTGRNMDQVPFFGDIPVLGVMFRRKRYRDDRNELLIFLTPRIVNRARALPM